MRKPTSIWDFCSIIHVFKKRIYTGSRFSVLQSKSLLTKMTAWSQLIKFGKQNRVTLNFIGILPDNKLIKFTQIIHKLNFVNLWKSSGWFRWSKSYRSRNSNQIAPVIRIRASFKIQERDC